MRTYRTFWSVAVWATFAYALLTLVGCQALGVPAPQTFNEKAYVVASALNESFNQAKILYRAGALSDTEAEHVSEVLNDGLEALQLARAMHQTDPLAASTKLDATIIILTQLQAYLASKRK